MTIFWISLFAVYILSFLARYFATPVPAESTFIKPNKFLTFLAVTILILVSGLRNNIGDTVFYIHSYVTIPLSWDDIGFKADFGFNLFQMLLQRTTDDPQLLIFTTALITNLLIVLVLYKYSRMFELSLYVYITYGMYLTSMNGIRQFLAAAIFFAATQYIFNGEWKKYMIVVLFASTFHQTALILIPMYFLVRRRAWTWETFMILLFSVIMVIGFNQFTGALFAAIEDTKYSEYKNFSEGGANVIRVVVYAMPLVLAYLGREKLREIFPKSDYIVNMSILGLVFMLISTQNWIFARFTFYFGLYNLILISWVVKLFADKNQKFVYYTILVCYFIYYFYESVITLNVIYESDFIKI
ncbi:EpsG family protein [Bacillus songklensis]|uniref:EpsG family protein n=1 Tax=Bacillus songklensis TaxID=1069116 RepID=A0ABV8B6G7_9BACI